MCGGCRGEDERDQFNLSRTAGHRAARRVERARRRDGMGKAGARARAVLDANGFAVEHLEIERETQQYASLEAALAAVVGLEDKWRSDGRWFRYIKYLEEGGRTLTRSHLIVKARRR